MISYKKTRILRTNLKVLGIVVFLLMQLALKFMHVLYFSNIFGKKERHDLMV